MSSYYFLGTLLAPLTLDHEPEVNITELKELCRINLSHEDQRQMRLFLTLVDLSNLNTLWSGQNITITGNWTKEELEDLQKFTLNAPPFLEEFLRLYKDFESRFAHFDQLMISFFSYAYGMARGFLKEYLEYEQVLRVALAVRRGQKLQKDFTSELKLLDPIDPWQAELESVARGGVDILGRLEAVQEALDLYDSDFPSPIDLFKQLLLLRFENISNLKARYSPFSVDAIIAYAAQLELVTRWQSVNKAKNKAQVMTILKDIKHG